MNIQRSVGVVVVAMAIVATACSADGYVDGPVLTSERPALFGGDGMDAIVEGAVALDDGCLFLVSGDVAYPVIWPHGASWAADTPAVILDGQVIEVGMRVTGSGGYIPIVPGRLDGALGADVAGAAERCAGPTNELALFNAGSSVVVIDD